jgi:hypothetical protein
VKDEINRFRTKADPKYDFTIALDVALDRPEPVAGIQAVSMLNGFVAVIESILMILETDARRIGLFK